MEILKKDTTFDKNGSTVQEIFQKFEDSQIRRNPETSTQSDISFLTDNLILCSASSINPSLLEMLDVKCIVNAAPELPDTPLLNNDMIYHKIPILDCGNSRILPYFDGAADLIHKVANSDSGKILVYCVAGVSRSATICLAYFMKCHHFSLLEAYNYVKLKRPKIRPNCGFFKQLMEYEKCLFACNSVGMVYNEFVQMEIPDVYNCEYQFNSYRKNRSQNGRY